VIIVSRPPRAGNRGGSFCSAPPRTRPDRNRPGFLFQDNEFQIPQTPPPLEVAARQFVQGRCECPCRPAWRDGQPGQTPRDYPDRRSAGQRRGLSSSTRQTSSITGGCTIAGDSGVVRRGGKRDRLVAFRALSQGASIIQALQPSSASWLGSP
jgi:hypothetical protein